VVATSVMLTFISYWRAAAIVLNDLGSSAFYACGIAEQAVGKSAAWFIVAVMLFSFTVRAVYVESCSMFVRGGVYRVVKEALGSTLAKISVSALMFDYILTGPISGVSAGQYIAGLINDTMLIADTHGWVPRAVHAIYDGAGCLIAQRFVAFAGKEHEFPSSDFFHPCQHRQRGSCQPAYPIEHHAPAQPQKVLLPLQDAVKHRHPKRQ